MNTLVLFATFEEAEATLKHVKATETPWLFVWEKGYLCITGIGSFAALIAASSLIEKVEKVCHFGLAGALNPTLEQGALFEISAVSKLHWHPRGQEAARRAASATLCEPIALKSQGPSLVSSDMPVYSRAELTFDLVDMEAYAAALLAKKHEKECLIFKVASDRCDENSGTTIRQNLKKYSETLAEAFISHLK